MDRTFTLTSALIVAALAMPVLPASAQVRGGGGHQGGGGGGRAASAPSRPSGGGGGGSAPRASAPRGTFSAPSSSGGGQFRSYGSPQGRTYSQPQGLPRGGGNSVYSAPRSVGGAYGGGRTYSTPQALPRGGGNPSYSTPRSLPRSVGGSYGTPQSLPRSGGGGSYGGAQALPRGGSGSYGSSQLLPRSGGGGSYSGGAQALPRGGGGGSYGSANNYRGGAGPRDFDRGRGGFGRDRGFDGDRGRWVTRGGYHGYFGEVRPYYYSDFYVRPYGWRPYYPYRFVRPYYAFSPWFDIGFGLWVGYPVPYPWVYLGDYRPTVFGTYYSDDYQMVPAPAPVQPTYGGVSFDIQPADADLFVDGQYVGVVGSFGSSNEPLTLEPGTHRIAIQRQGFRSLEWEVTIDAGQVIPYRGVLERQ